MRCSTFLPENLNSAGCRLSRSWPWFLQRAQDSPSPDRLVDLLTPGYYRRSEWRPICLLTINVVIPTQLSNLSRAGWFCSVLLVPAFPCFEAPLHANFWISFKDFLLNVGCIFLKSLQHVVNDQITNFQRMAMEWCYGWLPYSATWSTWSPVTARDYTSINIKRIEACKILGKLTLNHIIQSSKVLPVQMQRKRNSTSTPVLDAWNHHQKLAALPTRHKRQRPHVSKVATFHNNRPVVPSQMLAALPASPDTSLQAVLISACTSTRSP